MATQLSTADDGTGIHGAKRSADQLQLIANLPSAFSSDPWTFTDGSLPGLFGKTVPMPAHITAKRTSYFAGGDGSQSNPYQIATAAQLAKLAELVNVGDATYNSAYYELTADLDLSAYGKGYNSGKGWMPIGSLTNSKPFKGHLDGGGKIITGLYINDSDLEYAGLFGSLSSHLIGGTLKNLGLVNVSITGKTYVGSVVGSVHQDAYVTNCYATGSVGGTTEVGGIVGRVSSINNSVTSCYAASSVSGGNTVGGIVGNLSNGSVTSCYATGPLSGGNYVGGIVGRISSSNINVTSCYATGPVSGGDYVGGIVGRIFSSSSVTSCAALSPSVSGSNVGRVVGRNDSGTLAGNYAFSAMKGGGTAKTGDGLDGADTSIVAIMSGTTFWKDTLSWNDSIWAIQNSKLPILQNVGGAQSGDGGLYLTEQDLQYASVTVDGTYTYTGSKLTPAIKVTFDGDTLVKDRDYNVAITSTDRGGASAGTNVGEVTITVTGIGNFTGTKTATFIIQPKQLTAAIVTVEGESLSYNGTAQKPGITVKDGDTMLTQDTDYENMTYGNNTNAGHAASVSITGKGNYQGTITKNFTISKAALTITDGTVAAKAYDGTTNAVISDVTFSGLQNSDTLVLNTDYTVTGAQYTSANAGSGKVVTVTVALKDNEKANNYILVSNSLNLTGQTIGKAAAAVGVNQTFEAVEGHAKDYEFDLTTLLPNVTGTLGTVEYSPSITANSDGVLGTLSYTSGDTLVIPVLSVADAGKTATITVTVSSANYSDFIAAITVKTVDTIPLTITGITLDSKSYDGTNTAFLRGTAVLEMSKIETGDDVTLSGTPSAVFDNANAGTNKMVTITGLSLTGNEAHKYRLDLSGFTGTIEPKPLTAAMITIEDSTLTYTGTEQRPGITLKDGNTTLVLNTDYENVTYGNNTNAVHAASVSITGKGNYQGTITKNFTIGKAALTITDGTVEAKAYDGTTNAVISDVTFSGLQNSDTLVLNTDYTVTGAQFNSADAGSGKVVTATMVLKDNAKANNYILVSNSLNLTGQTIGKAAAAVGVNQTFEAVEGHAKDYEFDLTTLLPNVTGTLGTVEYSPSITANSDGVLGSLAYTSGNTLTFPVQAVAPNKTAIITVTVYSSNYNDFTATLTVKTVNKTPVSISGVTMTGGIYNGSPYAYIGTPAFFMLSADGSPVSITDFDVLYTSSDSGGYSREDAPINAGVYQLKISVPDSNMAYTGSQSYSFTIEKRPVTVRADDQSMTRGGTLPTFTYTVDGQLSDETALAVTPTFTCAADGKTTGSYPITIDLTGVSYTANYMAAIPSSVDGTLTVNNSSGGGGGGTSAPVETPKAETNVAGNTVTATTTATVAVDSSGNAAATVSRTQVSDAIGKVMEEAEKQGEGTVARVEIKVEAPADVTTAETSIPQESVSQASETGIGALTISTPVASITFDANALSTLSREATGDVKITASRVAASSLSPEAQRTVGDRPVFDFSVTSGGRTISQFGGDVLVSVPYTPREGEDTNAIVIYYINDLGELAIVSNCIYDPATGRISFSTRHFSKYAVGYNKVTFQDVAKSAWYSKAVGFIAAREITTGTGGGNFGPEAKLTRGQFIVMLMKAYGIAPDAGPKDNFADAGATYYTGYLAAAKRLSISGGVGNNMFAPGKEITRQEMLTLLYNALKAIGRLPEGTAGKQLSAFTDAGNIAPWAREAMTLLVETGVIGGNGGKLSPASTTTRAEMAQVLYNLLSK